MFDIQIDLKFHLFERKLNEPESENSEKLDDVQQHKRDLDKLKEIDPEFRQTLKDNNLLMLGEGNVEVRY